MAALGALEFMGREGAVKALAPARPERRRSFESISTQVFVTTLGQRFRFTGAPDVLGLVNKRYYYKESGLQ